MNFKKIIYFAFCLLILCFSCSCTPNNPTYDDANLVGVAIYQNAPENNKWNVVENNKSIINNLIETKENKIVYNENPEFLFFIYSQNILNNSSKNTDFISNTTRDNVYFEDSILTFNIERIAEPTDILIYFVYKENNTYYLKFIKEVNNISNEIASIVLKTKHPNFTAINLTLSTNLSVKKEY